MDRTVIGEGEAELKRLISGLLLTMLIVNILTLSFSAKPTESSPSTIIVPDDYPTIQEAINAASEGDTVFVRNGTYSEVVTVNKPVSLVGEELDSTIINGTVLVESNNVEIAKLCVEGGQGISLENVMGCTVNYTISRGSHGFGVSLLNACNSQISFCRTYSNYYDGICLDHESNSNVISNNDIYEVNRDGIGIHQSTLNIVEANRITRSGTGLHIRYSNGNTLLKNTITVCYTGIWMEHSTTNKLYHNSFVDVITSTCVPDSANNTWDDGYPSGGNYWSDYSGNDSNHEGIGDIPYIIDVNNQDNYPLMHLYGSIRNLNTSLTYLTIQSAINAPETQVGHMILVRNGTYYENITIDKTVSLIGENMATTIIDGGQTTTVILITANNVRVEGFTIQNSSDTESGVRVGYGLAVEYSDNCTITSNTFAHNRNSIGLWHATNTNITQNTCKNSYRGMRFDHSSHNFIIGNVILNHSMYGIDLYYCDGSVIDGNILFNNYYGITVQGDSNTIVNNNISKSNWEAILIGSSTLNNVTGNFVTECNWGIYLAVSITNRVSNNIVRDNTRGLDIAWGSQYNIISQNEVTGNDLGICIRNSSNYNTVIHNSFAENVVQVQSEGTLNVWDGNYPSGGNYWSDYSGVDLYSGSYQNETGSDGIGDTPYVINDCNQDNYPLMNPWSSGWELDFAGPTNHPVVDFAVYNGSLCAAADSKFYVKNGSTWDVIDAPTFVTSLEPYGDRLVVGGQGGLYCYDGASFGLIFSVPTYIKVLGAYNSTLYAGTFLDKPPILHYCNGNADNPDNWHIDTSFSAILNFSGPFGSVDSFAEYDGNLYVTSGGNIYSHSETGWNAVKTFDGVYGFSCMQAYNDKLYLATRDQGWRKPLYQGGTGFSGRVIEFDGENWTTVLDHDYWVYSLEVYDGKLYAGTANKILTYNGTDWGTSFNATELAYYAISMIIYDGKIYAGMGNGYIFADPAPPKTNPETVTVPEFPSTAIPAVLMALTVLAAALTRKNRTKRFN